jgi:hypothetical protein
MTAPADFLRIQFIGNLDEALQTSLVTLAPPSLSAPTDGESAEAFADRRARFAALIAARTEVLRRFSQTVPLIPTVIAASPPRAGSGSFAQVLPATARDADASREGLLRVAADLAEGLGTFHDAGEYHLGVLPELLRDDGARTYLCGIGADLRSLLPARFSHADLGDPRFFPPELFDGSMASKVGPWSDVYQMSATLHDLALGHPPPGLIERIADPAGTLARIRAELDTAPALAGTGMAAAIAAGLNLSRANRPQDAAAWARDIDFGPMAAPRARAQAAPAIAQPVATQALELKEEQEKPAEPVPDAAAPPQPEAAPPADPREQLMAEPPHDAAPPPPSSGRGCGLLAILGLLLLGGLGAGLAYVSGMFDPRAPGYAITAPEEPIETPIAEAPEPLPEPSPTAEPEPELPQVDWLLGIWAVNQDQTGCTKALKIEKGDTEDTLVFSNPAADLKQADAFEQDEPDSLTTSAWTYVREDGFIRMVGVGRNKGLTATLSKCAVPGDAEAEAEE